MVELSEKVLEVMNQIDQEDLEMEQLKTTLNGKSWKNEMSDFKTKAPRSSPIAVRIPGKVIGLGN